MKVLGTSSWKKLGAGLVVLVLLGFGALLYMHRSQTTQTTVDSKGASEMSDQLNLLKGEWRYMPGTTLQKNQLVIQAATFALIEQSGAGGQANPPLNLFGTHIDALGNLRIEASGTNMGDGAAIQLYSKVPVIADEFRIEPKSLRLAVQGTTLVVTAWDEGKQTPVLEQTLTVPGLGTAPLNLVLERIGDKLTITANGKALQLDGRLLPPGAIWFGFSGASKPWQVTALKAKSLDESLVQAIDTSKAQIEASSLPLQQLASKKRPGFIVGAALALGPTVSDHSYAQIAFGGTFGQLTPENALKWQFVHPAPGVYSFNEADALVALAQQHHMTVQGHTLVFGEANPAWVRNLPKDKLEAAMVDHIKTVVGHYRGKIATWDVVNEPFDDDQWSVLRPHVWYQAMGEAYIAKAFRAAHEADPSAKLFINEYGLEEDGDRWNAMLALLRRLQQQGVPINGIGFQAHVYEAGDAINPAVLKQHIQKLASMGLQARISEMDVYSEGGEQVQADQYAKVLTMCLQEPNCISFSTWGISNRYDYFKDNGQIEQGEDFLWNAAMQPTPAALRLQQILQ